MARKKKGASASQWGDVDGGSAFVIPYTLLRHPNFIRLSPLGTKLLLDLGRQYSGFNNGYLSAAFALLKDQGWRSETTVREAAAECLHYELIQKTRQGGRNRCNLFALTWWRIHEKSRQPLDVSPTLHPSDAWKRPKPPWDRPSRRKKTKRKNDLVLPPRLPPTPSADGVTASVTPLRWSKSATATDAGAMTPSSRSQ